MHVQIHDEFGEVIALEIEKRYYVDLKRRAKSAGLSLQNFCELQYRMKGNLI